MVTRNGLMRIFWPSDAPKQLTPGVLVGFRNSALDVTVVAVLQDVHAPRDVEKALAVGTLLRHSPYNIQDLLRRCGHSSLRVIGSTNPQTPPEHLDPLLLTVYIDPQTGFPRLYWPADSHLTLQVVVYNRPHPTQMQYFSALPISLALGDKSDLGEWDSAFEGAREAEQRERERKQKLVEKLKLHTVMAHTATQKETSLPRIINQINCSFELNAVLQKNTSMIGKRLKRALSVSERVVESANNLWDYMYIALVYVWGTLLYPVFAQVFVLGLLAHRVAGELLLQVLEWRPGSSDSPALKDISATAQQLDIRLQQFCYWPVQYLTLRKRKGNWESITNSHPEYIRFYNSLWLVANDIIIGMALGSYIIENSVFVATQVDTIFNVWAIEGLRGMISWLMEWPGGLKLNTELAEFMGDLFLWVIDHWAGACNSISHV
jgi:phosphatidylinositol glycan class Q protein